MYEIFSSYRSFSSIAVGCDRAPNKITHPTAYTTGSLLTIFRKYDKSISIYLLKIKT